MTINETFKGYRCMALSQIQQRIKHKCTSTYSEIVYLLNI